MAEPPPAQIDVPLLPKTAETVVVAHNTKSSKKTAASFCSVQSIVFSVLMVVGVCTIATSFVYLTIIPDGDGGGIENMNSNLVFIAMVVTGGLITAGTTFAWIYIYCCQSAPLPKSDDEEDDGEAESYA